MVDRTQGLSVSKQACEARDAAGCSSQAAYFANGELVPRDEKQAVGIVRVVKEAHIDSMDPTGQWECVDVAAVKELPNPVTLAEIKATITSVETKLKAAADTTVQATLKAELDAAKATLTPATPPFAATNCGSRKRRSSIRGCG